MNNSTRHSSPFNTHCKQDGSHPSSTNTNSGVLLPEQARLWPHLNDTSAWIKMSAAANVTPVIDISTTPP
jgi:hypothetical protein